VLAGSLGQLGGWFYTQFLVVPGFAIELELAVWSGTLAQKHYPI